MGAYRDGELRLFWLRDGPWGTKANVWVSPALAEDGNLEIANFMEFGIAAMERYRQSNTPSRINEPPVA